MMKNTIAFMGANFVARQVGYQMTEGWGQGDSSAQDHFRAPATFEERFNELLGEVKAAGFDAMDLWTAHLHFAWATEAQIAATRRMARETGIQLTSYAGGFGGTLEDFEKSCRLCEALEIPLFSGGSPLVRKDRPGMTKLLRQYGLRIAVENHPQASVEAVVNMPGEGDEDVIGIALDTGWLVTQKVDVLEALRAAAPRLFHLHLKDVLPPREEKTGLMFVDMGHETCTLGEGLVPVAECLSLLPELGFEGLISVEHEPETHNPLEDCTVSLQRVKEWMGAK